MLSEVIISDPQNCRGKTVLLFPYRAASETWLLINRFQCQEGIWINPISGAAAIINRRDCDATYYSETNCNETGFNETVV